MKKTQGLSCTSHASSAQQPHRARGYNSGQLSIEISIITKSAIEQYSPGASSFFLTTVECSIV